MSRHLSPSQVHAKLKHPIVDGDGHWLEYAPVFSEKMRKAGGDKAADGFLAALKSTTDALKMSPAERAERRVAQPNFWNRQAENTLDRATAMMPKMLYERLDEIGTDFAVIYPTAGLRLPRIKDDETRRAVIRAYNIVSADYFRGLDDRMTPAAIIPMHTRTRRSPNSNSPPSSSAPRSACSAAACRARCRRRRQRPRGAPLYRVVRRARHRQPVRLRPGLGEMRRARHRADLPLQRQRPGAAQQPVELRLQPYRPFRRRRPRRRQGHLPRRGDAALPGTAFRLSSKAGSAGARNCSAT